MRITQLQLSGNALTLEQVFDVAHNGVEAIVLDEAGLQNVRESRSFLEQEMKDKIIYGVNTGFGPMASFTISEPHLRELQVNLIRSHAAGMGEALPAPFVLAAMIVRLNTLLKGGSGVSEALIGRLKEFVEQRIVPVVPEFGSVGTSGDLVHLAHIALAIIGEGECLWNGRRTPTNEAFQQCSIPLRYEVKAKEGLSLINGTSFMSGVAALACVETERILSLAIRIGALALECAHAYQDSIHEGLHETRPHPGQVAVARQLREILSSSQLLREHNGLLPNMENGVVKEMPEVYQEVYSLRCIAQILGPICEVWRRSCDTITREINSVTDNPVVDWKRKIVLHGGNFHGEYTATAMDELKAALVKLIMLSERRINFFLHQKLNCRFPPFLNVKQPGLTLGLQGMQFVATALAARAQSCAFPHRVHSISTNADNQDLVSMGSDAALFCMKVVDIAYRLLALEAVTLLQAADIVGEKEKFSASSRALYETVRRVFPIVVEDRALSSELETVVSELKKEHAVMYTLDVIQE